MGSSILAMLRTLVVLSVLVSVAVAAGPVYETFNIRPGRDGKAAATMDGHTCLFDYSAVGGTNEEWNLVLEKHNGEFHCTVQRPRASYLGFKYFNIYFDPPLSITQQRAESNNGPLPFGNQYVKEDAGTKVTNHAGNWSGELRSLFVVGKPN